MSAAFLLDRRFGARAPSSDSPSAKGTIAARTTRCRNASWQSRSASTKAVTTPPSAGAAAIGVKEQPYHGGSVKLALAVAADQSDVTGLVPGAEASWLPARAVCMERHLTLGARGSPQETSWV